MKHAANKYIHLNLSSENKKSENLPKRQSPELSKKLKVWYLEASPEELTGTTDPRINAAFQYFCHYVFQSLKDDCNLKDTGYVKCPSDNFRRMFGRDTWNIVRKIALKTIMVCDEHCVPAVFNGMGTSYGYKFLPSVLGRNWQKQYMIKSPKLECKLISEINRIQKERAKYMTKTHKELAKWQNSLHFQDLPPITTFTPKKKRLKKGKARITLAEWHSLLQAKIDDINNKEFRYTVPTGGRAYQTKTGIDTKAREYLRSNGKQIIEIDVKNCHMTLLQFVISKYYNQYVYSEYSHMGVETHLSNEFVKVYSEKDWYQYLADNIPEIKSRGAAKTAWQNYMYDRNRPNRPISRFMASRFPHINKAIAFMKGEDSSKFAVLLQATEAEIIFEGARLFLARRLGYVGSVHDSLTAWAENADELENCLRESFNSYGIFHANFERNLWK
jgi:hypothetical protein